ncbi:MAG TPA: SH3 domain-containing protein [Anaerolineaceae bacterium]|nr:SH3 domain-containing protein [Anaerolineaceae bacterium]
MNWKRASIVLLMALLAVGCNMPAPGAKSPTLAPAATAAKPTVALTVIPPQFTVTPGASQPSASATGSPAEPSQPPAAATAAQPPEPAATQPPAATSFTPFTATSTVNALKLRTGPGYLFPAAMLVNQGESLTVRGRSRGDEWIYVKAKSGIQGWVFALLIQPEKDLKTAPEVEPGDVLVVRGRLVDKTGAPVNGVQFALIQGSGGEAPRTDALTDATGTFYAFFPRTSSGQWSVSYAAISCTSKVMDQNCNCQGGVCGTAKPASIQITLPQEATLEFTWE